MINNYSHIIEAVASLGTDVEKISTDVQSALELAEDASTRAVPVGTITYTAASEPPEGYLICNGALVGRTVYPELFAAIGTTYGAGDGTSTFALPNLMNKTVWGSTTVGTEKEAGLPNITGQMTPALVTNQSGGTASLAIKNATDAFTTLDNNLARPYYTNAGNTTSTDFNCGVGLDASKSNSIYGNSDTVQPPALTLLPVIKAFGYATDAGTINIGELIKSVDALKDVADGSSNNITEILESVNNVSGLVTVEKERAEAAESALSGDIAKCLPLSGGTMTGKILFNSGLARIENTNSNQAFGIWGAPSEDDGAFLYLRGKSNAYYPGAFSITASNGTNKTQLLGEADGTLRWDGKTVRPCANNHNTTDTWIPVFATNNGMPVFDYILKSEIARSGSYTYNSGEGWGQFRYNICSNFWIEAGWNTYRGGNTCRFTTPEFTTWIDVGGWRSGTSTSNWAPGIAENGSNFVDVFSAERDGLFYFIRIGTR